MINQSGIRHRVHGQLHFWLLVGIAVTLPFFVNINSYLIVLLALNSLIEGRFGEKWRLLRQRPMIWLFAGFFLLHVISLIYSNAETGMLILERRLALVVLPVVIGTSVLSQVELRKVLLFFAAAVTLASGIAVGWAVVRFFAEGTSHQFFYHALTEPLGISAIYLSCYSVFVILILLNLIFKNTKIFQSKALIWLWIGWLTFFLVLLSSKMFLFLFAILLNGYLVYHLIKSRRYARVSWLLAANVAFIGLLFLLPQTRERFQLVLETDFSVVQEQQYRYNTPFSGLSLRLVLWRMSKEVLYEHQDWLRGTGLGDAQQLLNEKYQEYNLYTGNPELGDTGYFNYNVHNQYIQTLLELGIIGMLALAAIFGAMAWVAIKYRLELMLLFVLMMFCFGLSEVFLATHKGVVFFSFFGAMFLSNMGSD